MQGETIMRIWTSIATVIGLIASASSVNAGSVGERHLLAVQPTAIPRNADHADRLRVTVWYPAADGSAEQSIDIGPPGRPLFKIGAVAQDAAFSDAKPRPVILFSHGFGGTARMMAWFTVPLAWAGYVVIAVDHPGNNGLEKMTLPGSVLFWDRPGDLAAALARVKADPAIAPHLDLGRLGVAGFSAGGFTALATAGGRVDLAHFWAFCASHPDDGICRPQMEMPMTLEAERKAPAAPDLAAETARAGDDHAIPGVRAVFVMAPALIESFDPASLKAIGVPVGVILGDIDAVAPPATNGELAAADIPAAELTVLHGVGHYDFIGTCTPAGLAVVPVCTAKVPQDPTHQAAIDKALAFFARTLGAP
jgi:predicted dienelactone hydrolase